MGLPTRLADRENAWAVLVGTSTYDSQPTIAQAVPSILEVERVLTEPGGLFAKDRVRVVVDPKSVEEVVSALDGIAGKRPEVVLFYYIGHGQQASLSGDDSGPTGLFLGLTGTVDGGPDTVLTGLPVNTVFSRLRLLTRHGSTAVVVLDCCHASRALDDPAVGDAHVLCATGKTSPANYDLTAEYTGFTGVLLDLLRDGMPDGPRYLDLNTLFHYLSVLLPTTPCESSQEPNGCLPRPRMRTTDHRGNLALARNKAFGTALTPAGLAARTEFADRVASSGRDPLLPVADQRMLLDHATDLYAGIAADTAAAIRDATVSQEMAV